MNKKKVAIIYDEYDAKIFNENKINVDCIKVLTPNAYVKLNKYNKNILIKANQIINDKKHKEILIKTDQILKKIIFNLKYSSLLSSCKQTIIDRLSVIIPTYIYLNYFFNLKEITLVVNNNKITECKDSLSFFNLLHKKIISKNYEIFFGKKIIHNFIINFVSIIINYFFLFTNKKKNVVWINNAYDYKNTICEQITLNNNNVVFYCIIPAGENLFKYIILNIKSFFQFTKKIKIYYFKPQYKLSKENAELFKTIQDTLTKNGISTNKYILNDLKSDIQYIQSIYKSTKKFIIKSNCKILISNHMRFREYALIAEITNNLDIPILLISHGSHTAPTNNIIKIAQFYNSNGMLFSKFNTISLVQSKLALECINTYVKKPKVIKTSPIIWGLSKINIHKSKGKLIKILHASSPKILCTRPYIYETPFEYLDNIISLISSLSKFKNIQLTIRFRENSECSYKNFIKLIPKSKNVILKNSGSFSEDISSSDCLISYSSTTIEEALYLRKPVILFSKTNRYQHIKESKKYKNDFSLVTHGNTQNIDEIISDLVNKKININLFEEDLKKYIWYEEKYDKKNILKFINSKYISK